MSIPGFRNSVRAVPKAVGPKLIPNVPKALAKSKKAKAFFDTLNKANVYSIVYRLQTAKSPETREKRMRTILEMMNRGEKFHP